MNAPERLFTLAAELLRGGPGDGQHALRSYRRLRKSLIKLVKVIALMAAAAIVIPVALITFGVLLGPRGTEGLIITPLAVLTAWAAILFWALRSRPTRRAIARSDLPELPERTAEWLDRQRPKLPAGAQHELDAISQRLEALRPQVQGLDPQTLEALELRRLIADELPELVHGFQKVPLALRRKPLHDGPSPERRLVEGLRTVDEQVGRLHERLADGDLQDLAAHQRYLELKYKRDDELE